MGSLSIVIPSYNRSQFLEECVLSCVPLAGVLSEITVADDASTDDSVALLEALAVRLAAQRVRLQVLTHEENCGAPHCRNRGYEASRGDYVLFLDSDDVLAPAGILAALERLRACDLEMVHGKVQSVESDVTPVPGAIVGAPFHREAAYLAGYHWHTMGAIYRRDLLERVGGWNEQLTGSQDWEYQARIKLAVSRWEFCDAIFGFWRRHQHERVGARGFRNDYVKSVLVACRGIATEATKAGKYTPELAWALAKKMFLHGLEYSCAGHPREAVEVLKEACALPALPRHKRLALYPWRFAPARAHNWLFRAIMGRHGRS